jgi:hypothetical protein
MRQAKNVRKTTLDRFTVSTAEFPTHYQTLIFADLGELPEFIMDELGGIWASQVGFETYTQSDADSEHDYCVSIVLKYFRSLG